MIRKWIIFKDSKMSKRIVNAEWSGSKKWSWAGFDEVERRGGRDKKVNKIRTAWTCVLGNVVMSVLSVVF